MFKLYERPLDLLLDLVRQHKVPVEEVPLAPLTAEFLEYMAHAEALDIDLGIEFAYTASILIQLKSQALLPRQEPQEKARLMRELLTPEQVRQAADFLGSRKRVEDASFGRPLPCPDPDAPAEPYTLLRLMQDFRALAERDWSPPPVYVPEGEEVSTAEMIEWLEGRLGDSAAAGPLFEEQRSVARKIALFLGLLDMATSRRIVLNQSEQFGPIQINRLYT
jgi:segregation and condensation protein A